MNKLNNIALVDTTVNQYERLRNIVKDKEQYDTVLWDWARKESKEDLDAYAVALASDKLPSLQTLNDKWAYAAAPESNKIFMLSIASNKDALSKDDTRKKRTYDIYNPDGSVKETKDLGELTDYDYYDTIFSIEAMAHNEYQRQLDYEQWKKDRGWFANALIDVGTVITDFGLGVVETVTGLFETIADVCGTVGYSIGASFYELAGKGNADWEGTLRDIWGKEQLVPMQQVIAEWNNSKRYFTDMVDIWGGQSFWSALASGVATSVGNIVGAVITQNWVSGTLGALGAGEKVVKTVGTIAHQIAYYGTMFEKSVIGDVAKDVNNEHSIFEILSVNAATTAWEYVSEWALGKVFGFTKTSALQFGTKETGIIIKNPLARGMINAIKEGSQEVVQELGDWLITSIVDGFDNKNGFYSDPMTFERLAQSFLAGIISESLISGVTWVTNTISANHWVDEFMLKENPYDVNSESKSIFDTRDNAQKELETLKKDYSEGKPLVFNIYEDMPNEEASNIEYYKGDVMYDQAYNERIAKFETKFNEASARADAEQTKINERAANRRITYGEHKKEFRHGILGLFNALQMLNDKTWKLGNDKRSQKLASWLREIMATSFQGISQLYGAMGETAFNDFVNTISKFEMNEDVIVQNKKQLDIMTGTDAMKYTLNNAISAINDLISNYKVDTETAKKAGKTIKNVIEKVDKAAKTSNEVKTAAKTETEIICGMIFDNDNKSFKNAKGEEVNVSDDPDVNQKAVDTAAELSDKGLAVCVKTQNDVNVFGDKNGVIIPIQNITDSVDAILTSAGLNNNIFSMSGELPLGVKEQIFELFNKFNDTPTKFTFEDIMKILLGTNNTDFLRCVVWTSGTETIQFLTTFAKQLMDNSAENADDNNAKNPVTLATISTARQMAQNLIPILVEYAQTMAVVDPSITEVLKTIDNGKYKDAINRYRYNYMLRNSLIENGINGVPKNQKARYESIIETRLKNYNSTVDMPTRDELREWIYSDKRNIRERGFAYLDTYYNYIYSGTYNNYVYLEANSVRNMIFNSWLKKNDLTVQDILKKSTAEQTLLIRRFNDDTIGRYNFEITMDKNRPITITDLKPEKSKPQLHRPDNKIKNEQEIYKQDKPIILSYQTVSDKPVNEVFNDILRVRDDINNAFLSVDNIIESSEEYLNEYFLKSIKEKYDVINRDTVYMALNNWLLAKDNETMIGIVPNQNGNLIIVEYAYPDYYLRKDLQRKGHKDLSAYKQNKLYDISEFISKTKLIGDLANIKVRFANTAKKNGGITHNYNDTSNIITLNAACLQDANLLRFALLHEFSHAVAFYNGLNGGMSFIENPDDIPQKLANDIKEHVNIDTDIDTDTDAKNLSFWLYYSTGAEFNAEGVGFAYKSFPAIRKAYAGGTKILLPWGNEYNIPYNKKQQFVKDGLSVMDECSAKWKSYCDGIVGMQGAYVVDHTALSVANMSELDFAFLLPDGRIVAGFDDTQNHIDIKRTWRTQLGFDETFMQSIINVRTNERMMSELNENIRPSIYADIGGAGEGIDLNITDNALNVLSMIADFAISNNFEFACDLFYNNDKTKVTISSLTENANNGNVLIRKFINKIRNVVNAPESIQEHISDVDDETMKSFTKTRRVTDDVLTDAKKYIDSVNTAKLAQAKGEPVTRKVFPVLSAEVLKGIREETYDSNKDELFKRAEKIIKLREKHITGEQRRQIRKERGETYSYGYINPTKAKGTVAQFYLNAGKFAQYRPKLSLGMRNFLYSLNSENLDKLNYELREMFSPDNLKIGNLPSETNIYEFIRIHYDDMNDFTFNLIKENLFPNSPVNSAKDLENLAKSIVNLYGYNTALLELGIGETNKDGVPTFDVVLPELKEVRIADWFNKLKEMPGVENKMQAKLKQWYVTKKSSKSEISEAGNIDMGQAALSIMKYFDGTLNSITYIAGPLVYAMLHPDERVTRTKKDNKSDVSFDATVKGKRQGVDDDTSYAEIIGAYEDRLHLADRPVIQQRAIGIMAMQVDRAERVLSNELIKAQKQFTGNQEKMMAFTKYYKERKAKIQAYQDNMEEHILQTSPKPERNWTDAQIEQFVIKHRDIEMEIERQEDLDKMLSDFELLEKAYEPVKRTVEFARSDLRKYLNRQLNRTINDYTFNLFSNELRAFINAPKPKTNQKYTINEDALRNIKDAKTFDEIRSKFVEENRGIQSQLRALSRGELIRKDKATAMVKETEKRTAKTVAETKEKLTATETKLSAAEQEVINLKKELNEKGKEFEALTQAYSKAVKNTNNTVSYETVIPKTKITIKTDVPIPPVLHKMLNVVFTKMAPSQVQTLEVGDVIDDHVVMSATEFFKQTANLWSELTDGDAQRIIDFCKSVYFNGEVNLEDAIKVKNLTDLILYTLLEWDKGSQAGLSYKDGQWYYVDLTDEQRKDIKDMLYQGVSDGARKMQRYGELLKRSEPWRTVSNQLKYALGIEIDDDVWEEGQRLLATGKFDEFQKLSEREVRDRLVEKYKDDASAHRIRWIANQMIQYMRAAMLSAPKTIIRNRISNYAITALRKITEPVGNKIANLALKAQNVFRKKKGLQAIEGYREGQVDLTEKIDWTEHKQLNEDVDYFFNSAVMALFHDNITKYDIFEETEEAKVVTKSYWQLRIDQFRRDVQAEMMFDPKWIGTKLLQKMSKKFGFAYSFKDANDKLGFIEFVMRMQSDDQFIDKRAKEIFKRLLIKENLEGTVIELIQKAQDANVDPYAMLMTDDIFVRLLSKAYGQAAYEYMHRPSFFGAVANYLGKNYPWLSIVYRLTLPFVAGGFLWWQEANKYTPWHLVKSLIDFWQLDKIITKNTNVYEEWQSGKRTGERPKYAPEFTEYNIRTDVGKGIVGTIGMILAMVLGSLGFIIKDEDDDKYKFNFGIFTVDASQVFGMDMFSVGAAFAIATKNKEGVLDVLEAALGSTFENFFMSDIINQMRYNNGISDYFADKAFSIIGSFIPNVWKAMLRATNKYKLKYDQGLKGDLEYFAYQLVPFAFLFLPKKIDPYTGDLMVRNTDSWFINIANELGLAGGLTIKTDMPSKLERELSKLNAGVGDLKGDYEDIGQLDQNKLNVMYGKLNDRTLNDLINDKVAYEVEDEKTKKLVTRKYSQMTNKQKANVISRIKSKNAKYAKIYVWTSEGHKYYGTANEKKELTKLGIMQNVFIKTDKLKDFVK